MACLKPLEASRSLGEDDRVTPADGGLRRQTADGYLRAPGPHWRSEGLGRRPTSPPIRLRCELVQTNVQKPLATSTTACQRPM